MAAAEPFDWKYPNSISRINGYDKDAYTYIPVVIVGAGESGIAMGCRLKEELGFDQFRIYERQAGVGGTWWINRYPNVACDVPAVFYSFSFCPNPKWSTFHPSGPEIVKYLNDVCAQYEIMDKIQCNTDIEGCQWLETEQMWEVRVRHMVPGVGDLSVRDRNAKMEKEGVQSVYTKTEIVRAKVVCSAVGGLVEPKGWPDKIPGQDKFKGQIFHSARWRYDVDMRDKDVVVVGTGCSAAQFVPALTKAPFNAKSVTQLMRSPPWVVPRMQPPGGQRYWERWGPTLMSRVPGLNRLMRTAIFCVAEYDMRLFGGGEYHAQERKKLEAELLRHLQDTTPKKYHKMLTPDYGVGCKRRIFDATWFRGLNEANIELTTQPLASVQERSVTTGPGSTYPPAEAAAAEKEPAREIPADVIVLANGFETATWLHPLKITGREGADLVSVMAERGGPQAYQGTAMDGFPNFFMIFGPNTVTGHSSVILASENMVNYALKFMRPILAGNVQTVEVKRAAEQRWTAQLQAALRSMVWQSGGCNSWYVDDAGWNGTLYPWTQLHFTWRCMFPAWRDWDIVLTAQGRRRRAAARLARTLALLLALAGIWRARRAGATGLRGIFEYWRTLLVSRLQRAPTA